jgi:N-hydroxyarylamine O-acetyltransferase
MAADPWEIDRLDLAGYPGRLGIAAREPSREALNELHEAHVRSFTFDNIDVLIGQHPGVGLAAVQEKFVGRGRGGYCFPPAEAEARYYAEHVTYQPAGSQNPEGA